MTINSSNINKLMADRIATMRKNLGLSLGELAAKLPKEHRITRQMLNRYERNNSEITFKKFYQFCEAAKADPNKVLGLEPLQFKDKELQTLSYIRAFNKLTVAQKKLVSALVHGLNKELADD